MYKSFIRPVLFLFDPEKIHHFTFGLIKFLGKFPGVKGAWKRLYSYDSPTLEREYFGIKFKNPVGLAAGFDKDAKLIDEWACFGFGFVEIGTTTPKPQPGNDKPRLFRLPGDVAVINRMGFNNEGLPKTMARLEKRIPGIIIGGNIGKNKTTPNEEAASDYEKAFEGLFPHVDYFVVNVSSPNTPNLRALQEKEPLTRLLSGLQKLNGEKPARKPILLKIAPDLTEEQLLDIVEITKKVKLDGLIATNTTISREGLVTPKARIDEIGAGGLSGKPLKERALEVLTFLRDRLGPGFPIISVGGIMTPQDAVERMAAGASLLQIYTGFIYEGPSFVKRLNRAIDQSLSR